MSQYPNWKEEIESIKLRIDRCEKLANTLRTSLSDLIREIRTCESMKKSAQTDKNKISA